MAVIINEFEVIPEPAPQQADNSAAQQPVTAQNTLPQEVDSVLRMQYQRAARVRAD